MEYLGTKSSKKSPVTTDELDSAVADVNKEACHSWGGRALSNAMSPTDAACLSEFGANRLLGFPFNNFEFQYRREGTTYVKDTSVTKADLHNLLNGTSGKFSLGNTNNPTPSMGMRFVFKFSNGSSEASCLYCVAKKLLVRINSGGMNDLRIRVSGSMIDGSSFTELADVPVSGWPGWNSIPLDVTLGGYVGQTGSRYGQLAIELYSTAGTTVGNTSPVKIEGVRLIAPTLFNSTYSLAKDNLPYELNADGLPVFRKIVLTNGKQTASIYLDNDGRLVAEDSSGAHLL